MTRLPARHRRNALESGIKPFYPILPDADWIERLVPLGVRTVQLRYKGTQTQAIRQQITRSLEICIAHDCHLIVNDHWREALSLGAEHVHLGQEDLATADIPTMHAREMLVGISTHTPSEVEIALSAGADSIALGPIFASRAKNVGHAPQGPAKLSDWRRRIGDRPLIAIGGITLDQASAMLAAGADAVAVITDVTGHAEPERRTLEWLAWQNAVRI